MNMNTIKGFRFHPTDEELIEYLHDKTLDRDSLVQVIAQLPDICQFEPWQLPGQSVLQTGDRSWYFMYPPKYKYRNSKRINRTTSEGYWKPTGNARKILNPETGVQIGSKKTLVFYKGQCCDKDRAKTCWVMHEYELKAKAADNQKTFHLCKLKKKHGQADHSSSEVAELNQLSPYSLESHVINNAMSEDLIDPDGSSEPEASNNRNGVNDQFTSIEAYAGERSNQHNSVNEGKGSTLSSNFINHVVEDAMPQGQLSPVDVSMKLKEPSDDNEVQNPYGTVDQGEVSSNLILMNTDQMVPIERSNQHNIVIPDEMVPTERSNQHNIVIPAEGFKMPSDLVYPGHEDFIPTDLSYVDGLSLDELLAETEATNNSNWVQDQYITNIEDEFLNSIFADNEAYVQDQQITNREGDDYLAAENEGFSFPCVDTVESSNLMEKSRKRRRLEYDGSSHHIES